MVVFEAGVLVWTKYGEIFLRMASLHLSATFTRLLFPAKGSDPWWPSEYEKPKGKREHTVLFLGEGAGCFGEVPNSPKSIANWDENFSEVA